MNYFTNVWFNTSKLVDFGIEKGWNFKQAFVGYFIACLSVFISVPKLDFLGNAGFILYPIIALVFAVILSYIVPAVFFFIGKIWKGKRTFRDYRIIFGLSLIPEIINLIYKSFSYAILDDPEKENGILTLLITVISVRILTIGIAKTQKFSYDIALLNVLLPSIIFGLIYVSLYYI